MRTLVVATNTTSAGIEEEVRAAKIHRVDYLELGRQPGFGYMDYNALRRIPALKWVEDRLRMDIREAIRVAWRVRKEGYGQVFSMSERVGIPLALLLEREIKHVVQMAHGLSRPKLAVVQALSLAQRWKTIIAPTNAEAEVLRNSFGIYADRVRMLYYVVDTVFYSPEQCRAAPAEEEHFEALGLSYRDYPTLLAAMDLLPQITGYMRIGSTWYDYHTTLGRKTLPDNVRLKPFVPPATLRECYLQSRFNVTTLRETTQWSAGCTTVMQAQAMGRAVIATCTPGMSEYVQDGVTGILVPPNNPRELARAIRYLWENPAVADEMGRKAQIRARDLFSYDRWMGEILKILCEE